MVLKNDACENSTSTVLASEWRRGQRGLRQGKDRSSYSRRANDVNEVLSSADKDSRNKSCESDVRNDVGEGAEVVDSRTTPGSLSLGYDMKDTPDLMKHSQLSEATTQKSSVLSSYKCHDQTEFVMGSKGGSESDEKGEHSLPSSLGDDVFESDIEEEDVKVCDICGDAGREDLLAVCSRCSDGAEHTYCMREMLDKVPEANWLCEECKYNEALEARKLEHLKFLGTERSKSLGRISSASSDVSSKLDRKDSFSERSKPKTVSLSKQLSLKRSGDNIEACLTDKKQVIESNTGSPTALSPSRVPVLSKESSFKNLDKTKAKPANQYFKGTDSGGNSSENTCSPTRNSEGNLVKSNSHAFSMENIKGSEVVVSKQKLVVDVKDATGKLMGKSMSFKGLGRSIAGEPKVKMLSPKCAPVQELKGQKHIRDRNSFERKNSIKLDNSVSIQTTPYSTKRLSRNDSVSTSSVSNSTDYKIAQSDGKLTCLSKQASTTSYKSSDAMTSLGEVKRLSSSNFRGSGTSSSAEAKPSNVSSKDGPTSSSSRAFDGSYSGANGTKADLHDSQSENALEDAFVQSRQSVNGVLVGGKRRGFPLDASTQRVKDELPEENKLKAAIEAAMQRKQEISKKNEKRSELSMSNPQGNHVGDTISNQVAGHLLNEGEAVHGKDTRLSNHKSNPCNNISIGSAKQFKDVDVASYPEGDQYTASIIPEQEAIWQGGLEIHRNGKVHDFCGGFQAHLSSSASDKVLEVVRKLPPKIVFKEISRLRVWPFQLREASAREDNIALYFFARDHESYLRSYKVVLEYMMKHDLALLGNINGIELLIFSSNHLGHKSQCWNNLFFMWGVFRGRRARCVDDRCPPRERPEIVVSVSSNIPRIEDNSSFECPSKYTSLQRPAAEHSSLRGSDAVVSRSDAPVLDGPSLQKSGHLVDGGCNNEGCNVGGTSLSSPTSQVNLEKMSAKSSSVLTETCSDTGNAAVEGHSQSDHKVEQHQCSSYDGDRANSLFHESGKPLSNDFIDKRDIHSHSSKLHMVIQQENCSVFASENTENNADEKSDKSLKQEDRCVDNSKKNGGKITSVNNVDPMVENKDSMWKNDKVETKGKNRLKQEGYVDMNKSAECNMADLNSSECSPKRQSNEDSIKLPSEVTSDVTFQKMQWMDQNLSKGNDKASSTKRIKGNGGFYGRDTQSVPSSFSDRVDSQMNDVSTSSHIDDVFNKAVDEKLNSLNPGSTERCFFLVDSHPTQSAPSEEHSSSSPWKVPLLGNENRLPDGSPDLELALGVEKKQTRTGILPFFAGIVDREDPDGPPDIASPREKDEDASASLSLSLAFPSLDTDSPAMSKMPFMTAERHEANTSLPFVKGSSGK